MYENESKSLIYVFSYFVPAKTRFGRPAKKRMKKKYENFWKMFSTVIDCTIMKHLHTKKFYNTVCSLFFFVNVKPVLILNGTYYGVCILYQYYEKIALNHQLLLLQITNHMYRKRQLLLLQLIIYRIIFNYLLEDIDLDEAFAKK